MIHKMNFGQLETAVLRRCWITLYDDDLLSDGSPAEAAFMQRYTKTQVDDAINSAYATLCVSTKAIKSWVLLPLRANINTYRLPEQVAGIMSVYYFQSETSYVELESVVMQDLDILASGWLTDTGEPERYALGPMSYRFPTIVVSPTPIVGATAVSLDSQVFQTSEALSVTEAVKGYAAPASSANVFIDSLDRDFVKLGVIVGQTIQNLTDGSQGTISEVSGSSITATLSGGSTNVWNPGDEMLVTGGSYITESDETYPFIVSSDPTNIPLPGIGMRTGNLLILSYNYPMKLVETTQYPELPPMFHQTIADGAAGLLMGENPPGSPEFAKAAEYIKIFGESVALATRVLSSPARLRLISDSKWSRRWP